MKRQLLPDHTFGTFAAPLLGLPVSHVWHGHGSAIVLEFGILTQYPAHAAKQHPGEGEFSLMIEWSWRIEGRRSILGGSFGDERAWPRLFRALKGQQVTEAGLFGRYPEICLSLSGGWHVLSFMTGQGGPQWTLFNRQGPRSSWIHVRRTGVEIVEAA